MGGAARWGVTVLQANAEMDAGHIWASVEFTMPGGSKSSVYRTEVADAAAEAVLLAVTRFTTGRYRPEPLDYGRTDVTGASRPPCRQSDRTIDWAAETTEAVLPRLRAADSSPGVLDTIGDTEYYLFGGYPEDELRGLPGTILARRDGAICRATADGAVWIPQLRRRPAPGGPKTFKLPATLALGAQLDGVPAGPRPADAAARPAHLPADQLPRVRRGRLPGVQLPRRGHEHRPVPQPAGRLPARPGPPGQGDRARPAPGLLRQRHPPERDPGRRRSRRGVLAEHQRHRRPGARDPDQHRPAHRGRAGRERRGRRADAGAGRRPGMVPVRRGPQPALPPDGPARLGILDLHPAPPRGRRPRRPG